MQFIWLSTALFAVMLGGQLSSCSKSSPRSSGAGGGTSGATSEIEVSGSISEEEPVDFVQAADSVSISGVNLTGNISYLVTAYSLEPNGFKKLIFTGTFLEPKFSFKSPVAREYMVIEITRLPDGGQFGAVLPPPVGNKQASLVVDGTTTIAAKMASLIATKAASGDHEAQQVLSSGSVSVADILMVSQSVHTTVIEQKDQGKGSSINLSILAANLISKSNERMSKLNAEGQSSSAIAEKLSESSYQTIFGDEAKIAPAGVLAYRVNPDLGSSEAAKITIAYEAIKASGSDSMKPVDEAFRVEATAYRTANSVTEAAAAKTQVTTDFKVVFSSCISSPSSCAQTSYTPQQPPSSSIETARAPGIPTSFTGTAGDGQVELTWAAPANNGGAAIMDYIIEYKKVSDAVWLLFADGVSINTSTVVLGLENGVSYNFRVAAKNSKASGAYSDIINKNPLPTGCSGNGPCSTDGRYYVDGIALPGLDSAGNGYSSIVGKYYIGGLATSLSQAGNGDFNGRRYVGGQYFTGFDNGVCFVDGVSTSLVSNGKGFCDGKYYIGGLHKPGLDSSGSGQSNDGKYYVDGSLANGFVDDKTVLLMHMDGTNESTNFVDSSANNQLVAVKGDAQISSDFSKFGGSSAYFNGNSSRLEIPGGSEYDFTGDFTIEMWSFMLAEGTWNPVGNNYPLFTLAAPIDQCGGPMITVWEGTPSTAFWLFGTGNWDTQVIQGSIPRAQWFHIAMTRESGIIRGFIDGVKVVETPNATPASNCNSLLSIGGRLFDAGEPQENHYNGYIDELRVTNGQARYTENFSPPQSAFAAVPKGYYKDGVPQPGLDSTGTGLNSADNKYYINGVLANGKINDGTILLLHMDGPDGSTVFTDSSFQANNVISGGLPSIRESQSKFGDASTYFDGSSHLSLNPSETLAFGNGDFTAEAWINWSGTIPASNPIHSGLQKRYSQIFGGHVVGSDADWSVLLLDDGRLYYQGLHGSPFFTSAQTLTANSWSHISVVRKNNVIKFYIDGIEDSNSVTSSQTIPSVLKFGIGGESITNTAYFQGYMDEIRLIKGRAQYSGSFTVPSEPFTNCYTNGLPRSCTSSD